MRKRSEDSKERALNEEERQVGAAVATVMEEETVRLLRGGGHSRIRGLLRSNCEVKQRPCSRVSL